MPVVLPEREIEKPENSITCRDGCGRTCETMEAATQQGWEFLHISKRWRCPSCYRELSQANQGPQE